MATYNNYSVSVSKGSFYLKSKNPASGYESVTHGLNGEKVSYHKYENGITGLLKYLDIKEINFEGKTIRFFEITLVDGDTNNKISVPLKGTKGSYTEETKALISSLVGATPGKKYSITVQTKKTPGKNGKEYTNLTFWLNDLGDINTVTGKPNSTGFIPYKDIPQPIKEEDAVSGVSWDWRPVDKFYTQKIMELQAKFGATPANSTPSESAPQPTPKPAVATTEQKPVSQSPASDFDDDDDLPF